MLATVTARLNKADDEVTSLKRMAGQEELTPEAKRACVDEAVQKVVGLLVWAVLLDLPLAAPHEGEVHLGVLGLLLLLLEQLGPADTGHLFVLQALEALHHSLLVTRTALQDLISARLF